jgi:hypothetical protein
MPIHDGVRRPIHDGVRLPIRDGGVGPPVCGGHVWTSAPSQLSTTPPTCPNSR